MKLACYTDLHGTIPNSPKEDVDFAVFCGDLAGHNPNGNGVGNASDFRFQCDFFFKKFLPFAKSFSCPVLFVFGNHDLFADKSKTGKFWKHKKFDVLAELNKALAGSNVHYVNRREVVLNGVKFYGHNYVPYIANRWAFQYPEFCPNEFAQGLCEEIPKDVNIFITHTPPSGILDKSKDKNYGCPIISKFLSYGGLDDLKLHAFGHSHNRGTMEDYKVKFVNAAISGHGREFNDAAPLTGCPYNIQSLDPIIVTV